MLRFDVQGSDELRKYLLRLLVKVDDGDIVDAVGGYLLDKNRKRFLKKVDPDGVPWVPSTAGERREAKGLPGTLFDTGTLFRSIELFKDGKNTRFLGTPVTYAEKHQNPQGSAGGSPFDNIQRRFLGVSDEDADTSEKMVTNMIRRALRA